MISHHSGLIEVEMASYPFPCDKTIIGMDIVASGDLRIDQSFGLISELASTNNVICSFELPGVVILEDSMNESTKMKSKFHVSVRSVRADEENFFCFPQEPLRGK
ncbi:hypothetical protein DITRI_Ditri06bG0104400 [Diplodiscus trichospermus]